MYRDNSAKPGGIIESNTQNRRLPITTLVVLVVTGVVLVFGRIDLPLLDTLRRNPAAFSSGEWWRLFTPLFVDPDAWWQIAIKLGGIGIVGTAVERVFGSGRWLVLYFGAGLAGEIAGYAWDPTGAGSSVALCGLIGGLLLMLILRRAAFSPLPILFAICLVASLLGADLGGPLFAGALTALAGGGLSIILRQANGSSRLRWVGVIGLASAMLLTAYRDIHGPAVLAGTVLAWGLLLTWKTGGVPVDGNFQ